MLKFARITENHDSLAFTVSPCARFEYHHFLRMRPAGTAFEIDLREFQAWSGKSRKNPFCIEWIIKAFKQLVNIGLVEILKKYNAFEFKIKAFHPEQVFSFPKPETNPQPNENSDEPKSEPINNEPEPKVELSNEPKVVSDELSDEPESKVEETTENEVKTINEKASLQLEQIDQLGVRLNPILTKLVKVTEAVIIADAISAYQEYKRQTAVKNPTGCMIKAIKEKWQPSENSHASKFSLEFLEWYQKAIAEGKVMNVPIEYLPRNHYNEPMVRINKPSPFGPYTLISWREVDQLET